MTTLGTSADGHARSGCRLLREYQGALAATPRAQLDVMADPDVVPATADRDRRLVEALRLREATAADTGHFALETPQRRNRSHHQ